MTQAFAIGQHVWTVSGQAWACRCGQQMREWRDLAGRQHFTSAEPCTYRPQRRFAVGRDASGLATSLGWMGDW